MLKIDRSALRKHRSRRQQPYGVDAGQKSRGQYWALAPAVVGVERRELQRSGRRVYASDQFSRVFGCDGVYATNFAAEHLARWSCSKCDSVRYRRSREHCVQRSAENCKPSFTASRGLQPICSVGRSSAATRRAVLCSRRGRLRGCEAHSCFAGSYVSRSSCPRSDLSTWHYTIRM